MLALFVGIVAGLARLAYEWWRKITKVPSE